MNAIKSLLLVMSFIVACGSLQADVTGENLILADGSNTVLSETGSSDWFDAENTNPPAGPKWFYRTNAFCSAVDPLLGSVNVSYSSNNTYGDEVRSTIIGLTPGVQYRVWILTSLTSDGARALDGGFDDGSDLTTYGVSNSTDTGLESHPGWYLAEGDLGIAEADGSGEIKVLTAYASGAERSVYHGVAYSVVTSATNPTPADNAVRIFPDTDPSLMWDAGVDPSNPTQINPAITKHIVYMSAENEPNNAPILTEVVRTDPGVTEWNPTGLWELETDKVYYWRVDERLQDDANSIAGDLWMFSTVASYPQFDEDYPVNIRKDDDGSDAVYMVVATNPLNEPPDAAGLSYQWYKAPDVMLSDGADYSGTGTDTLTVIAADTGDEGDYFCHVTIDSNGHQSDSPAAYLAIKRLVGHWDFEGNLNDSTANANHGTGVGTIGYDPNVAIVGTACLHLDNFDNDTPITNNDVSYVEIPHIDAYKQDALTVSCWIKNIKNGYVDTVNYYGSLVSKTDTTETNPGWALRRNSYTRGSRWYTYGSPGLNSSNDDVFLDGADWYHLAAVYDEENSFKALYLNGVEFSSVDDLGTDIGLMVADGKLCIGADIYGGDGPRSPGEFLLDDVRLYNYAMDKFEIGQLYVDVMNIDLCVDEPTFDLDDDCDIDIDDLKAFAEQIWLESGIAAAH